MPSPNFSETVDMNQNPRMNTDNQSIFYLGRFHHAVDTLIAYPKKEHSKRDHSYARRAPAEYQQQYTQLEKLFKSINLSIPETINSDYDSMEVKALWNLWTQNSDIKLQ